MRARARKAAGFTVMELCITIAVIAILITLTLPGISYLRARAQAAQCISNLRNLYVAADLYVQQNGNWPRVPRDAASTSEEYADAWVKALEPVGATRQTWICPTIQGMLDSPDYASPGNARIDYFPMPFDDKPTTPHQWSRQPWFLEAGNVHGNGSLIIFTDGSVSDLDTILRGAIRKK